MGGGGQWGLGWFGVYFVGEKSFGRIFMPVGSCTLHFLTLKCCKYATVPHRERESAAKGKLLSDSQTSDKGNMEWYSEAVLLQLSQQKGSSRGKNHGEFSSHLWNWSIWNTSACWLNREPFFPLQIGTGVLNLQDPTEKSFAEQECDLRMRKQPVFQPSVSIIKTREVLWSFPWDWKMCPGQGKYF